MNNINKKKKKVTERYLTKDKLSPHTPLPCLNHALIDIILVCYLCLLVYYIIAVLTLHRLVCFIFSHSKWPHYNLFNFCNARLSPCITFLFIDYELTLSFFLSYMVYIFIITSLQFMSSLTFYDFKYFVVFWKIPFLLLAAVTVCLFTHTCRILAPCLTPPTTVHLQGNNPHSQAVSKSAHYLVSHQ